MSGSGMVQPPSRASAAQYGYAGWPSSEQDPLLPSVISIPMSSIQPDAGEYFKQCIWVRCRHIQPHWPPIQKRADFFFRVWHDQMLVVVMRQILKLHVLTLKCLTKGKVALIYLVWMLFARIYRWCTREIVISFPLHESSQTTRRIHRKLFSFLRT